MPNSETQVSLPSIAILLVLGGLVVRYLFFNSGSSPASTSAQSGASNPAAAVRRREEAVAQLQQMFPQLDRRTLLWDLQRSGGNMAATAERALAGRLDTPPLSFQPPPPPESPTAQPSSRTATPAAQEKKPNTPDLITRYNLQDKLAKGDVEVDKDLAKGTKAWSSSKEERQSLLQKRRDAMILEARRKMEAKLKAEKAASS